MLALIKGAHPQRRVLIGLAVLPQLGCGAVSWRWQAHFFNAG
jgi:hypothetical protein